MSPEDDEVLAQGKRRPRRALGTLAYMSIDEVLIAHGELIPVGGGAYVTEHVRGPGAMKWEVLASPLRAAWPAGVTPVGLIHGEGVREVRLSS